MQTLKRGLSSMGISNQNQNQPVNNEKKLNDLQSMDVPVTNADCHSCEHKCDGDIEEFPKNLDSKLFLYRLYIYLCKNLAENNLTCR